MGWLDYHLHRFTMPHPRTKQERIFGIHNLSQDCDDPPGWSHQIASMFTERNNTALYEYDFGDDWRHTVRLVEVLRRDFKLRYPRCVGGERACPPEDCGGIHSFAKIVTALTTSKLDKDTRAWLLKRYDPASFDPAAVHFSDPARRLAYSWGKVSEADIRGNPRSDIQLAWAHADVPRPAVCLRQPARCRSTGARSYSGGTGHTG